MKSPFLRNLQIGFGLSLFILLVSSVGSYISTYKLKDRSEWVNHTNIVIQQSEKAFSQLIDAESGQRGYLLTGNETFLVPFKAAKDNIYITLDSLTNLTKDNSKQQAKCKQLHSLVQQRFSRLDQLISLQESGIVIPGDHLLAGQRIMDSTRQLIAVIQSEEQQLLAGRTESFVVYARLTPILLVIAALVAIFITINFYSKIKKDYELRLVLQNNLEENEKEVNKRINIIEEIASQISAGNYKVRVRDNEKDNLGRLSGALNQMATALEDSFEDYKKREWLKNGQAVLNEQIIGEKDVQTLSKKVIQTIAEYTSSHAAAIYLYDNKMLKLTAGVALDNQTKKTIAIGEGLIGQCAETQKMIVLNHLPQENIIISYTSGEVKPDNLVIFPIIWENELKAVIEFVSFKEYSSTLTDFFTRVSSNIGLSIESAQQHTRLHLLFNETQAQAEELQMQQNELEQLNSDLEAQAQMLQVSEEELKVQQEELLQANGELEERSSMLEEKNQMIVERNLEIQKKSDELETSTRYKSEFLANMSHELRTPLNSILLLSRLMAENGDKNLTKEQVEFANVIQSSGNGLLTLIDEILDLSKIEAGKMKVEFRDVHINEIKNNLNALFAPVAKDRHLDFSILVNEKAPEIIHTDSARLEQVLKNFLSNALKFTSRGSVKLEVKPAVDDKIEFIVSDTGIGIPADKQNIIFEAFQQADGSTRRKFGGTGLGLSISRELTKLLGGDIYLQSEPGKGSSFSVMIPVRGAAATDKEEELPKAKPAQNKYSAETVPLTAAEVPDVMLDDRNNIQPGDKVVLIIEDNYTFAQTLFSFAHKNNYKALVASRGDHGIQLANIYLPTAILLDVMLPVKDGWQVMDELKSNMATKYIPVHMMSSSTQVKEESLSRGAVDFLDKSSALDKLPEVFRKIEEALQRGPKKILIVEENEKHAQALCYFLESYNINVKGTQEISDAIKILQDGSADCVVLEIKVFTNNAYEALEKVKNTVGLEHLPIIIFTGKSLSKTEEVRIKQIADSIVVKSANSYKRILDEIDVFLQIIEENNNDKPKHITRRLSALEQVLENKTVLIADDDVRNIYSLTKALEGHKMNVLSATDGKDAMEQLKQNPKVNIVLMDMMMPEMDGYEATQAIRKMPQYRNLPILAVTAKAMYADREKCIQAGASDYISKPIDVDQLISLLRVWLYQ